MGPRGLFEVCITCGWWCRERLIDIRRASNAGSQISLVVRRVIRIARPGSHSILAYVIREIPAHSPHAGNCEAVIAILRQHGFQKSAQEVSRLGSEPSIIHSRSAYVVCNIPVHTSFPRKIANSTQGQGFSVSARLLKVPDTPHRNCISDQSKSNANSAIQQFRMLDRLAVFEAFPQSV